MEQNKNFKSTFQNKLIYIFRINDKSHDGLLKIGEATVSDELLISANDFLPNSNVLNKAAKNRINQYTSTAGIVYELLYTELAINKKNEPYRDYDVHKVLERSGIEKFYFNTDKKQNEWFKVSLNVAINAIKATNECRKSLNSNEVDIKSDPIIFRPEQKLAIDKTIKMFKNSNRMLWNAKMRFGKTLTALEVAKRMNFKKTIIITHRPVVSDSWFEDFYKIFRDGECLFGSKFKGESLNNLLKSENNIVYFASMQDLRGSEKVGGNYNKNNEIFNQNWDFVVVDEAHEGTKTNQGTATLTEIIKGDNNYPTKVLELSGTPFNLIDDYNEDEIYTWDYVMEQDAKHNWIKNNFGDSNPYEELPRLNIYTYNLNKLIPGYEDIMDKAFNFKEFFRVWTGDVEIDRKPIPQGKTIGSFVHENDILSFLNLISKKDSYSNYPFSKDEYREYFRHSLWMLPGVKEAKALSKILKSHPVFSQFRIVNVAGEGDEEEAYQDALQKVRDAIGNNPGENYTITLSCGKLTTGVNVKEWTAVFMLAGSYSTAASNYLQTIFRVQTPAKINGKMKEECYVFDFAPDRTLKMVAQAGQLSIKAGSTNSKVIMGQFLNYCPVISIQGSNMEKYSVDKMLQQLKKAYADKVVQNGFDDAKIYNDNLLRLDGLELEKFSQLQQIIGASKQTNKINQIDINNQGFNKEELEEIEKIEKKKKTELTEEEKRKLEELKEKKKNANTAISILRGISIRIPLLIYGADIDIDEDITCDNFTEIVDDDSWNEFMPKGVTKKMFNEFSKYYDEDIFIESGRQIRKKALYADTLSPLDRVKCITELFSTFKNPDKETVLTPWKAVNMHLSDCLGGYAFFDEKFEQILNIPRLVDNGVVTKNTLLNENSKILEINSKSGLYPLYIAYSLFVKKCDSYIENELIESLKNKLWEDVVMNNVFVICKTPMAKLITKRTLVGYKDVSVNAHYYDDLVNMMINKPQQFIEKINKGSYWKKGGIDKMNFDAIVGNPPYTVIDGGGGSSSTPIYNFFVETAVKYSPKYISMIIPSRWFSGGKGLDNFRTNMLNDTRISILHDYIDARDCFNNVNIEGGVCYYLWDKDHKGKCIIYNHNQAKELKTQERFLNDTENVDIVIRDQESIDILKKVMEHNEETFLNYVYPRNVYKVEPNFKDFIKDNETGIKLLCRMNNKREICNLDSNYNYKKVEELEHKYKLFMSKADGAAGQLGNPIPAKIIGKPEYGFPNMICSETFLVIGKYDSELEMKNAAKYLNTKFAKFLIGIRKNKNMTMDTYKYLPLQNFKHDSDIKWNDDIKNIDNQLYVKYNFNTQEIQFIEKMIK